jgi:pyruvate dehydrogenase E2 component (dihydrolipoamide acetyltransferase)
LEAIVVPKLGLTMKKATIVKWHKREGEAVRKDEVIAEIETDKVTCQIESPRDGVLLKILGQKGAIVLVGGVIAYVGQQGERIPESASAPQSSSAQSVPTTPASAQAVIPGSSTVEKKRVSPRAKRLVEEKQIDLSRIVGTGPEGMILESDVIAYIETNLNKTTTGLKVKQVIPFSAIRRAIAENMSASLQGTAQVTLTSEVDASSLQKVLSQPPGENRLTYTDLLVLLVSKTLENHPLLNATVEDEQIKIIEEVNVGVGVAAESGLVVPVIRNSNKKSLDEISVSLKELGEKARQQKLTLQDVSGGTFTISNLGMFGVSAFTPIINPPQTAILGVGEIALKPQVISEGAIEARPIMMLSLTFDHRAMDGHIAANFLRDLKKSIESASS